MHPSFFPVRYSQLSPGALMTEISERYDIGIPVECRFFRMGMNDVYLVRTENETYFLRISPAGVYKLNDYEEEVAIINLLHCHDIGVANPIKCRDGSSIWSVNAPEGERFAILFPEAKNQPSQDRLKCMYNLGVTIARMHMITDENNVKVSRPPIDLVQLVDTPKKLIKRYFVNRMGDYEYLCDSMDKLSQFISDTLPMTKPYYAFCHGDLHLSNVNINGEQPVMFDFDTMGYGWRAHDLAVFLFNHTLQNEKFRESDSWKSLLDGYNSVRKLDDNELRALPAFCALRNTWVLGIRTKLSEIHDNYQLPDRVLNIFFNTFKFWYNITTGDNK